MNIHTMSDLRVGATASRNKIKTPIGGTAATELPLTVVPEITLQAMRGERFPEGTTDAVLRGAQPAEAGCVSGVPKESAPRDLVPVIGPSGVPRDRRADDDEPTAWGIDRQLEITVFACTDGTVRIEQEGELGRAEDDGGIVVVAQSNAVALARRILWAAGFKGILIAETKGHGYEDLNDGATP